MIERHPLTMKLAEQLGYSVTELNLEALTDRYRGRADPGLDRIGRFG